MELRNQVEWVLHCCTVLAALPEGGRLSTRALAEFHGVPKEYLSKALQALARAGIVEGTLGPSGGYRLARPADEVSFLDVVEAVEGPGRAFVCNEIRRNNPCLGQFRPGGKCRIARVMWQAEDAWRRELASVRLSDVTRALEDDVPQDVMERSAQWLVDRAG